MIVDAGFVQSIEAKALLSVLAHPTYLAPPITEQLIVQNTVMTISHPTYLAVPIVEQLVAKVSVTGLAHPSTIAGVIAPVTVASIEIETVAHRTTLGGFEQTVQLSAFEVEALEVLGSIDSTAITAIAGFQPQKLIDSGLTATVVDSTDVIGISQGSILGSLFASANVSHNFSGITYPTSLAGLSEGVSVSSGTDTVSHPTILTGLLEKAVVSSSVDTYGSPTVFGEFTARLITSVSVRKVEEGNLTVSCIPKAEFTASVTKNLDFVETVVIEHNLLGQVVGLQINSGFQEATVVYSVLGSKKLLQADPILEVLTVDALLQSEVEPATIDAGFTVSATSSASLVVNKLVVSDFTLVSKLASIMHTAKQMQKGITSSISVSYEIETGIVLSVVTVSCLRSSCTLAVDVANKVLSNVSLTSAIMPSIVLKTTCITEATSQVSTITPEVVLTNRITVCQENCY